MSENDVQMSQNIGKILSSMNPEKVNNLSTLAKKGDDELVQLFLNENVSVSGEGTETSQSQLYMAAFWGIYDAVKVLVEGGAVDVNYQNGTSCWTPLHAAAFQEHGKVVMYLLEHQADPTSRDSMGRTPADFASVSDKVWPLFAASGLNRCSEVELIRKSVIRKPNDDQISMSMSSTDMDMNTIRKEGSTLPINYENRPASELKGDRNAQAAGMDGDVLAGDVNMAQRTEGASEEPNFNAWRN